MIMTKFAFTEVFRKPLYWCYGSFLNVIIGYILVYFGNDLRFSCEWNNKYLKLMLRSEVV